MIRVMSYDEVSFELNMTHKEIRHMANRLKLIEVFSLVFRIPAITKDSFLKYKKEVNYGNRS